MNLHARTLKVSLFSMLSRKNGTRTKPRKRNPHVFTRRELLLTAMMSARDLTGEVMSCLMYSFMLSLNSAAKAFDSPLSLGFNT